MVVAFLLVLILFPVLPNAGIDDISQNVLHISYLKGRIIFAIIIHIFHYKFIKTRYLTNKIYSSLTLFLYPILLYVMFHTENPINFIPYFISYVNIKRPTHKVGQVYTKIDIKPSGLTKERLAFMKTQMRLLYDDK